MVKVEIYKKKKPNHLDRDNPTKIKLKKKIQNLIIKKHNSAG